MKREKSSKGPNYKSVLITDEGIRIIEEGKRITDNVEKEMFSVLDKDEKKELTRLKKLYIGTKDPKTGACGSVLYLLEDYTFNHKVDIENGIMQEECEKILKDFFKNLRNKK